ncbi:hypothetical protein ACFQGW_09610 [Xanthomonas theicola]|uniref:hypothetical protein n=1 Tax=Xanthomonas theicola TaxID=56464 RepID=UPI00360E2DAF
MCRPDPEFHRQPAGRRHRRSPARGLPVKVDGSCRSDADCAVKNVGNCCGAMPACVNRDSPTDPQGVLAQCQASGRMSVCGARAIAGCQCVAGQCSARGAPADTLRAPAAAEPVH